MSSTSPLSPFTAKVMSSGKKAILMLPSRAKNPDMPFGVTDVMVDGRPAVAKFAKIAVNVVSFGDTNNLTEILQGWFGPDAGRPGTRFFVEFSMEGNALTMRPASL